MFIQLTLNIVSEEHDITKFFEILELCDFRPFCDFVVGTVKRVKLAAAQHTLQTSNEIVRNPKLFQRGRYGFKIIDFRDLVSSE